MSVIVLGRQKEKTRKYGTVNPTAEVHTGCDRQTKVGRLI